MWIVKRKSITMLEHVYNSYVCYPCGESFEMKFIAGNEVKGA